MKTNGRAELCLLTACQLHSAMCGVEQTRAKPWLQFRTSVLRHPLPRPHRGAK